MKPDVITAYSLVILLFPMGYFLCASLSFLFVRLGVPEVTTLLRWLINAYLLMVAGAAGLATLAFAGTGHPTFAVGAVLIGALALVLRRWLLRRIDRQRGAAEAGDQAAIRGFRLMHLGVMAANVIQFAAVLGAVPFVLPAT